jgi:Fe-S oxidoreductase
MNPLAMLLILVAALGVFSWSALRRWNLLLVGRPINRFDRLGERLRGVWRYAFKQQKMDYYSPAGAAHKLIFLGFIVLLLRSLILWGRAFSPSFNFWIFGPTQLPGELYDFVKDICATLVLAGVSVFFYYRLIHPQRRMTLHFEGVLILMIIATMMLADMVYDGASITLVTERVAVCGMHPVATATQCARLATIVAPYPPDLQAGYSFFPSPAGSLFASLFQTLALPVGALEVIAHIGFWTHSSLVLIFLNILPHSKHFHIITAIPNVFFRDLDPPGRLKPMAASAEKLMEIFEPVTELADPTAAPVGISRIEHVTWKAILDFYTCTECGRCSDNCPAHKTGKILSPKHLTLDLRDQLYSREAELVAGKAKAKAAKPAATPPVAPPAAEGAAAASPTERAAPSPFAPVELGKPIHFTEFIHPDVLWACTTCRACEEQCPVMISYVDKIVDMRRNLYLVKNEFPAQLQKPFQAMEVNGNPWNLSRMDRATWSDGLGIPTFADKPTAPVLFWVGCAASYDDRAKKIARATAKLLQTAGVDFAILGQEESCTGDPARRAGNEMLFLTLAEANAATLNGYKEQGGVRQVVTTCPHCFNSLKNEYPDIGCTLEVIHHTDFLLGLLAEKKLLPANAVPGRVVYHDSCYLGRYNGVYESPREILRAIPGVELVEAEYWNKQRGLCCGAGGAQMWMEEQNKDRVNVKRTLQLVDTGATTIASACPFCMTMLTDGVKAENLEEQIQQLDVAELLEKACANQPAVAVPDIIVPPPQADLSAPLAPPPPTA